MTVSLGLIRSPLFDSILILGTLVLALAAGGIVSADATLFNMVLLADMWFLGYHHVVSTYTRLYLDGETLKNYRFLSLYLLPIVAAVTVCIALVVGPWILATVYLYWQWFHYTRQSYGISRLYGRKNPTTESIDDKVTTWALYLVPIWGIAQRSYDSPIQFLGFPLYCLPVDIFMLTAIKIAAWCALSLWLIREGRRLVQGKVTFAYVAFLLSHHLIFIVGYVLLESLEHGWLVVNVWHNFQYILIVWLYNANRFKQGVDSNAWFLSTLSQPKNMWIYFLFCVTLSSGLYFGIGQIGSLVASPLTALIAAYSTINFHHYLVDAVIWKVRSAEVRSRLGVV